LEFKGLFEAIKPEEAPKVSCLKLAAAMHFGKLPVDTMTVSDLIVDITSVIGCDSEGGFRVDQLALVFDIITRKLNMSASKEECNSLMFFIWAPIVSILVQNANLSSKALRLLAKVLPWVKNNGLFKNYQGLCTTMYISDSLASSVAAYERYIGSKFSSSFLHTLIQILIWAFRINDKELKLSAIDFTKAMIMEMRDDEIDAVKFLLPVLGYTAPGQFDIQFAMETIFPEEAKEKPNIKMPKSGKVNEISSVKNEWSLDKMLMINSEDWPLKEQIWMVNYLYIMLEDENTVNRDSVINALLYATRYYPKACEVFRTKIVERCWNMIDNEDNPAKVDKTAFLAASMLSAAESGTNFEKEMKDATFTRMTMDGDIKKILYDVINGISVAVRLD